MVMMIQDDSLGGMKPEVVEVMEEASPSIDENSLAGYILRKYSDYDSNRQSSGIEGEIEDSLRSFNMEYSDKDLSRIAAEGSSPIYVGITSAKCRALAALMKDILVGVEKPYSIEPTSSPELPQEVTQKIAEYYAKLGDVQEPKEGEESQALASIKEINEKQRDAEKSMLEEVRLMAVHAFSKIERQIDDNLQEGSFYKALSAVIADFSWSPTAILKGPIVTKRGRLSWSNGQPVVSEEFIFFNRRVNPLDFYPAPDQSSFIEKLRFSAKDINDLIGVPGYDEGVLRNAIERPVGTQSVLNNSVDQEIVDNEDKGGDTDEGEIQGLHWFGYVPVSVLTKENINVTGAIANVECIMIGNEVAKVCVNDDPLGRHPYYFASFQRRPGSFWGTSLPKVMDSEQRLCNATVRALALNLGLSASPQCMITVDRLADDGDIDEIYGGKVWQVKSDPTGNSGRPLDFFNIPSNANELLAVFNRFLELADQTTGIPRYIYGGQTNMQGAGGTASGMAMLLEQSTKTIKDCIRHIDTGVIVPRVEQEFYHTMLKSEGTYTGDISVVAIGSQSLTNKAAEQLKRNEFLKITANSKDQELMGVEGRAELLRAMAKDLNLPENIVPSRMQLKEREAKQAEGAGAAKELEMKKINIPVEVATIQMQGTAQNNQLTQQTKTQGIQVDAEENAQDFQIEQGKLVLKEAEIEARYMGNKDSVEQKRESKNREIALSLKTIGTPGHDKVN